MATNTNTNKDSRTGKESAYQPGETYSPWDDNAGTLYHPDNGRDHEGNLDNGAGYNEKSDATQQAVDNLRDAEHSAVSRQEPSYPPTASTSEGKSYYTGNGGKSQATPKKGKGKFKKGGLGAVLTILLVFAGIGTFLGTSNSLLAPAMSALITETTQVNYTSYVLRTRFITKSMMNGTGSSAVTPRWTGSYKYSRIPTYLKGRLSKYNIEVIGSGAGTRLRWKDMDISADEFVNMYNNNVEFRSDYNKAKRGRVATFFDDTAEKFYRKLGLSRNWMANFKATTDAEADTENFNKTLSGQFDKSSSTVAGNSRREETEYVRDADGNIELDGDGNPKTITREVDEIIETPSKAGTDGADIEASKSSARSFIASAATAIADIGSVGCALAKVASMIGITVAANEIYQSISYFQTGMENPSKMKAGYGSESGINVYLNKLTTPATSAVTDFDGFTVDPHSQTNSAGENPPEEEQYGAPIQATALQNVLAATPLSAEDTKNYSLERVLKKLGGSIVFGAATAGVCAAIDIGSSIVSIASVFMGGVPKILGSFIARGIVAFAFQAAATAFLGFLIPTIARVLFSNVYDTATGIQAGNLLMQGTYAANSTNGRDGSGMSPTGEAQNAEFSHHTNTVLAMEADLDRYEHSPFDTTNRNTFFGSIAYSLLPTVTATDTSGIATFLRTTSKSFSSLIGKASAEGTGSSYTTTYGDCPMLESIGAKGDVFCNPITTTDMSTIDMSPNDAAYSNKIAESMENCDSEGNCTIKSRSELDKYISYCAKRTSPFGAVDQNILNDLELGSGSLLGSVLNSLPLVSDAVNIINAGIDATNIPWATGEKCGNTDTNATYWDSDAKYYQRYIEDQRILEQMGAYEGSTNPVTAAADRYEARLNETYKDVDPVVAYYSRISGLSPKNTETTLAFVYYYDFVNKYDPSVRIAMEGETSKLDESASVIAKAQSEHIKFHSSEYVNTPIVAHFHKYIIYADTRNRSYAIC